MKISNLAIDSLKEYVSGDNILMPYLSGPNILKLFNTVGFKDIYNHGSGGGMPENVSRNKYVFDKLLEVNGTNGLKVILEHIANPRHFAINPKLDMNVAVQSINQIIIQDGYRYELLDGIYKIIGADIPDEIVVEIHFEEIKNQIIEELKKAKFLIWVAVAWVTDKELLRILYERKKEGLNVQIIVIDDEINQKYGIEYEKYFEAYRKKPEGKYQNIMHHKFCIIDLKTVIHGSYNWTTKAQYNKETITIDTSKELAEKFATEFINLKN